LVNEARHLARAGVPLTHDEDMRICSSGAVNVGVEGTGVAVPSDVPDGYPVNH
jgi:hypothetical protein